MSYHPKQFRNLIERMLDAHDPKLASESAVLLLLGTAAQESKFGTYLMQTGQGPAIGAFQMEPATFRWLQQEFAHEYPALLMRYPREMEWDLRLAVIMARLRYRVVKDPLPGTDPVALAEYWKKHYNTSAGKGTPEEFIANWKKYVEGRV